MSSPAGAVLLALCGLLLSEAQAADLASRTLLLDGSQAGRAVIAVGERGLILRSTDDGRSWNQARTPTIATLTGVTFSDPLHGWAVGHDALILGSADGGLTWMKQWQADNLSDSFLDVEALDAEHVIAIGAYGLYVSTADGGHTWSRRKITPDDYHLNRISRASDGTLYLAGEHGTVLRSTDAGRTWVPLTLPYAGSFYGVLPLDAHTLLAYGLRGRAYRSSDNGQTWQAVPTSCSELLATALRLDDRTLVLGGQARTLLVSQDDGRSFRPTTRPTRGIAELLRLPDGDLLSLGEAGAVRFALADLPAAPASPAPTP